MGSFAIVFRLPGAAANIIVSPPTLPRNIISIRIICDTADNSGVMPRVRPTVATADAASNIQVRIGRPSIRLIAHEPKRKSDVYITNIAAAVVDEFGNIYGRATRKTAMPRPYNEIFDDMTPCAKEAAYNSGIKWENIESGGIGCPGAINKETGYVDFFNNLDFYDVPITDYM